MSQEAVLTPASAAPSREMASLARSSSADAVTPLPPPTLASRLIFFLLGAALVLSALAYGTNNAWALAIFQGGAGVIALLWAWDAWSSGVWRVSRSPLQLPLVGVALVAFIQMLPFGGESMSFDPYATRLAAIKTIALLIYFAAALAFIDSPLRLRSAVRLVIIFGCLVAALGMTQAVLSPEKIYGIRAVRFASPMGPFVNRHHFAGYMELALALPLGLLLAGGVARERYLLYGFAALVMGMALIGSGSRAGMLSLVAQVMFLVFVAGVTATTDARRRRQGGEEAERETRGRAWWLKRAGVALVALVVLFVAALAFGGEASLTRLVGTVNAENPTNGRMQFWATTIEIIRDHALLGVGLGAFAAAYTRYDTTNGADHLMQAHNDYLQVLSDTGMVGGVLALLFIVVLFRRGWLRLRSADQFRRGVALGALAGCFGVLVHSFFDFTLQTTANALLFLVLAALATLGSQVEEARVGSGRRRRRRSSAPDRADPAAAERAA